MTEPSKDDLADTVSALWRSMKEAREGTNEVRDALDYYSGSIIMLGNLLAILIALGLAFLVLHKVLKI